MSNTEIRERRDSDIPALAEVLIAVHEKDGYPVEGVADPIGWLENDRLIAAYTAILDGHPVGHVSLTSPGSADDAARLLTEKHNIPTSHIAVLGRLFVMPQARGYSLGRRLTETATRNARDASLTPVLDVMEKDKAAIALYESLGWHRLGSIQHNFGDGLSECAFAYAAPTDESNPAIVS